jgi:hypothetical protein
VVHRREARRLASQQVERRTGDGEVHEKLLELRHFRVSPYPEEAELTPSSAAGVARNGRMRTTARTEAVGCTIDGAQEAKMEILVEKGSPLMKRLMTTPLTMALCAGMVTFRRTSSWD